MKNIIDAGGIWIDIENRFEYASYDGSHLRGDSAEDFSIDLAEAVLRHIEIEEIPREFIEGNRSLRTGSY